MFSWYRPFHLFPHENRCFTTREPQKGQQFSFFKELVKTCLRTATYESLVKLSSPIPSKRPENFTCRAIAQSFYRKPTLLATIMY
jgi:hypothetical protein